MSPGTSQPRIRALGALFAAFCLSGASLASDAAPAVDDACAADATRLCPKAADASTRTLCLMQNRPELSAKCLEKTQKAWGPAFSAACAEDSKRYCAQIRGGGLRLIACIASHRDELGDTCRAYLEVATAKPKSAKP